MNTTYVSLKNLEREQISSMLYNFFESLGVTIVKEEGGIFKAMVPISNYGTADETLSKISIGSSLYMDHYIENVLNENPKTYNRNMILFESEPVASGFVFFRWF